MSFRFEFVDGLRIVMLHGSEPPPPESWQEYLTQIGQKDVTYLGLLVFTAGGAPDASQRRELNRILSGRHFARAIVHRSALVRGVVAAVSWFAPGVAAFEPGEWKEAAQHAGFRPEELPEVCNIVRRLHATMPERIPWLESALRGHSTRPPDALRPR